MQASHLKHELEQLNISRSNNTIASIDAKAMYPSVKFDHIKRAVEFYAHGLPDEDIISIQRCLGTFEDQYWEYGGTVPVKYKG